MRRRQSPPAAVLPTLKTPASSAACAIAPAAQIGQCGDVQAGIEIRHERFRQSWELSPSLHGVRQWRSQGFVGLNRSSSQKFFNFVCQVFSYSLKILQRMACGDIGNIFLQRFDGIRCLSIGSNPIGIRPLNGQSFRHRPKDGGDVLVMLWSGHHRSR